ncbi:hypothetical protein M3Y97_00432000 [Aphelenchoides bicaudatus]|nr:hypothetical protein M3Y97_00432000 [Aphelenchoides bicaudatus]
MSVYRVLILALVVGSVQAWMDESNFATIQDGRPITPNFNPVILNNNPRKRGVKVNDAYAALYMNDQRNIYFGQATVERDGRICALFKTDDGIDSRCSNFRVLQRSAKHHEFLSLKPENFDPRQYTTVDYVDGRTKKALILMYEEDTDSSFFGTLVTGDNQEPIAYGINYDKAPVEARGAQATSGDYILYVVSHSVNFKL